MPGVADLLVELHSRLGRHYQQVMSGVRHDYVPTAGDIFVELLGAGSSDISYTDDGSLPEVQFAVPVVETPEHEAFDLELATARAADALHRLVVRDGLGMSALPWCQVRKNSWSREYGWFEGAEPRARMVVMTQSYRVEEG